MSLVYTNFSPFSSMTARAAVASVIFFSIIDTSETGTAVWKVTSAPYSVFSMLISFVDKRYFAGIIIGADDIHKLHALHLVNAGVCKGKLGSFCICPDKSSGSKQSTTEISCNHNADICYLISRYHF